MELATASMTISFARKLEQDSARFYEGLSERYPQGKDVFLAFAKENGKFVQQLQRAYYSVISDALEGCFAFSMESDAYEFETGLEEGASHAVALDRAKEIEGKIEKFYLDAAKQSECLMADVPRAMLIIARKRGTRKMQLESLLGQG
ncbi:MAG: hypothetical protein HY675_12665 [Chloroflexi bacterium]|nr:hypothetical protein [Chloroflexota bacterium]